MHLAAVPAEPLVPGQVTFHQFMLPQLRADPKTGQPPTLRLGTLDQKHYPNRCGGWCGCDGAVSRGPKKLVAHTDGHGHFLSGRSVLVIGASIGFTVIKGFKHSPENRMLSAACLRLLPRMDRRQAGRPAGKGDSLWGVDMPCLVEAAPIRGKLTCPMHGAVLGGGHADCPPCTASSSP